MCITVGYIKCRHVSTFNCKSVKCILTKIVEYQFCYTCYKKGHRQNDDSDICYSGDHCCDQLDAYPTKGHIVLNEFFENHEEFLFALYFKEPCV